MRTIVCEHWLKGLCQKGNSCDFLHKMDKDRMPSCEHGKFCGNRSCLFKHNTIRERPECPLYNQGFCLHGPHCRFRHVKKQEEDIPYDQEAFLEVRGTDPFDQVSGFKRMKPPRYSQFRGGGGGDRGGGGGERKVLGGVDTSNVRYKISLCKHWLETGSCRFGETCHFAHGIHELRLDHFRDSSGVDSYQDLDQLPPMLTGEIQLPVSHQERNAFVFVKAPSRYAVQVSFVRQKWAVHALLIPTLERLMEEFDKVLLLFHVDEDRFCYGCAEMKEVPVAIEEEEEEEGGKSRSGLRNPNYQNRPGPLSYEFDVQWLRTVQIPYKLLAHIKAPDRGCFFHFFFFLFFILSFFFSFSFSRLSAPREHLHGCGHSVRHRLRAAHHDLPLPGNHLPAHRARAR